MAIQVLLSRGRFEFMGLAEQTYGTLPHHK